MAIPRPEHPTPDWERPHWQNLNGTWEFEQDPGVSGLDRHFETREHLNGTITVPFCPESTLSGVGNKDFLNCVWYRRSFRVDNPFPEGRTLLHFGAVDHTTHVFVNGIPVGQHIGGYASFCFDITSALKEGENLLTVCAIDLGRDPRYGHGKQSTKYASYRCLYTRVTGIWQTVWLEYVPVVHLVSAKYYPDIDNASLHIEAKVAGQGELTLRSLYEGRDTGCICVKVNSGETVHVTLPLSELHLWEVGHGRLYDLTLSFKDTKTGTTDTVKSYFGMRQLRFDGYKFLLNGQSVFQRLVLDQGYYPDGIYTAPDEATLERDIHLSLAAGFNGARLHQKVFEPRFLYHCDRLGYLVWGEYGNWGMDYSDIHVLPPFLNEWRDIIARDFNHPAIIGWCPLNETWDYEGRKQDDDLHRTLYRTTKSLDSTRPCIDTSGNYHVETDIFDMHDYQQSPEVFASLYATATPEEMIAVYDTVHHKVTSARQTYQHGTPVFISEYGGIRWDAENQVKDGWGYGNAPKTEEEFLMRYRALTDILLDSPYSFGFCYTQLYDVEQEANGLYTYERQPKFDMAYFKAVNSRKAKIED